MTTLAASLIDKVQIELRIPEDQDHDRLIELIDEAIFSLQQFKCKTLVLTVVHSATETTLSPLDVRYVVIYVALQYDGDDSFEKAFSNITEQVRDK